MSCEATAIAATSQHTPTAATTEPMVPERDLDAANATIAELTATIAALQRDLASSQSTVGKQEAELREARAAVATANAERDAPRTTAADQAAAIAGPGERVRELEAAATAAASAAPRRQRSISDVRAAGGSVACQPVGLGGLIGRMWSGRAEERPSMAAAVEGLGKLIAA